MSRRQVRQMVERRLDAGGVEDPAPHLEREQPTTHEVPRDRKRQTRREYDSTVRRRQAASTLATVLMAVSISAEKTIQFEAPRLLSTVQLLSTIDVTADGKRFLIPLPEGSNAPSPFTVVTNWQAVLKK